MSLLPARSAGGDTAAMVQARGDFLAAGHFAGLAAELTRAARAAGGPAAGCVADVGAGTGYYLAAVLDGLPGRAGLALDSSKFALRRAARAHRRIGAVGCDAWQPLPVADSAAALVLNVFAPRNGAELRRILAPSGTLLVVTPTRDHLAELVGPLELLAVDRRKPERLAGKLGPYFELAGRASTPRRSRCRAAPSASWWPWGQAPGTWTRPRSRPASRGCQNRFLSRSR